MGRFPQDWTSSMGIGAFSADVHIIRYSNMFRNILLIYVSHVLADFHTFGLIKHPYKLLKISIFSGYENHIFPKIHPKFTQISWVHGESQAQTPKAPRRTHAFPFPLLSSSLFCGWDPVGIRLGSRETPWISKSWMVHGKSPIEMPWT